VKVTAAKGDVLLEVKDLTAKVAETGEEILTGVTLTIKEGETHAIMGKNGSGKSTFTKVLVGHPSYEVTGGTATFRGQDLFAMEPEERARTGLFLSFQSPIEVPGVSNTDFLRMMCNERRKSRGGPETSTRASAAARRNVTRSSSWRSWRARCPSWTRSTRA
jgi:Fe-S cluster assembly ATP-binding protein